MNTSRYQSDFFGEETVAGYEDGQIRQLQKLQLQRIWELLLETRKKTGSEKLCGHLVDVGCGYGDMTRILSEHFERTTGIDVSPEQIMRAKELCTDPSIQFLVGKAEKLPVASNSADAITAIFTIHFTEINAFTSECLRVLKPGGVAVFWADHWGSFRSVDGSLPDATYLAQDFNRELLEMTREQSHPSFYVFDHHKTRFNELTVTENKSLHPDQIEVITSLAEVKKLALALPFCRRVTHGNPVDNLCKRLKALWKMEEAPDDEIILRGTRETFPIVIWK